MLGITFPRIFLEHKVNYHSVLTIYVIKKLHAQSIIPVIDLKAKKILG
jgi:hypothetical protein